MSKIAELDEELHRVGYDSTMPRRAKPDPGVQTRKNSCDRRSLSNKHSFRWQRQAGVEIHRKGAESERCGVFLFAGDEVPRRGLEPHVQSAANSTRPIGKIDRNNRDKQHAENR